MATLLYPIHLRAPTRQQAPGVSSTPEIAAMLDQDAVVAIGVSGGKDSMAVAIAVAKHLDAIGHNGPRLLIHSDLGRVEWKDSLPACERLASLLGWELVVVRRKAGDMLARWQGRWKANVQRYAELSCMKLILPWSTPSMRFCTSELKTAVITSALRKRFPTHSIVNVTGIRRQESDNRAKMPIAAPMAKLMRKNAVGFSWNAIIEWVIEDVFGTIDATGLQIHEGYTKYKMSRISCVWCIMSSLNDLAAAATCEDNVPLYLEMVELEAESSFAFQGSRWLADVAPHLLPDDLLRRIARAKAGAVLRVALEKKLPKHLHYTKGWPTCMPTDDEAKLIAEVRGMVARAVGISIGFTKGTEVRARFAELLEANA